ncbi:putative transcriptional regulator [Sedimentibacter acidaminivorans]|uniref:Transcriptional regulator n=1 Tax=Sedimentibacter acidaminivorans TaxID=913099 RepID=A0ABS4GA62_9FIRM|nr:helix-turn-helix transcriptional regulator [Sedimentibacter acidaminivorans]MBP1924571.1 putative transcriptional regulator [Sedimentibacter acidaminivorans]
MISYDKLKILMVKRKMQWKDIIANTGLSHTVTRKLNNDEYVDLRSLEKICIFLDVDIGDILEIKKE